MHWKTALLSFDVQKFAVGARPVISSVSIIIKAFDQTSYGSYGEKNSIDIRQTYKKCFMRYDLHTIKC